MKKVCREGGGGEAGVPKDLSMLGTRGKIAAMCRGPLSLGQRLRISPPGKGIESGEVFWGLLAERCCTQSASMRNECSRRGFPCHSKWGNLRIRGLVAQGKHRH